MNKISICGDVICLSEMIGINSHEPVTKKIDKNHYVDLRTGELFEYLNVGKSRIDNMRYVRETIRNGRDMINANVTHANMHNVTWITLTYRENMTDWNKIYVDFKHFVNRYLRTLGNCEYIVAVEPQERGSLHIHGLIIWENMPFIDWAVAVKKWGKGSVDLRTLDNVNNVGAYISSYLLNNPDKTNRLGLYPAKCRPIRWSRGCVKPIVRKISIVEASGIKKLYATQMTYNTHYSVTADNGHAIEITNTYYNKFV